jgi:hypothetical protein
MSEQFGPSYFPPVDIQSTQRILQEYEQTGAIKPLFITPNGKRISSDEVVMEWVGFCGNALKLHEMGDAFFNDRKLIIDYKAAVSYRLFTEALGEDAGEKDNILAVQSGFAMMLSQQAQEALSEEVKPAKELAPKVKEDMAKLVRNMRVLKVRHKYAEDQEWGRIYHGRKPY